MSQKCQLFSKYKPLPQGPVQPDGELQPGGHGGAGERGPGAQAGSLILHYYNIFIYILQGYFIIATLFIKIIYVQGRGAGAGAGPGGQEEPGQQHHQCLRQHGGQRGEGQDYSGII